MYLTDYHQKIFLASVKEKHSVATASYQKGFVHLELLLQQQKPLTVSMTDSESCVRYTFNMVTYFHKMKLTDATHHYALLTQTGHKENIVFVFSDINLVKPVILGKTTKRSVLQFVFTYWAVNPICKPESPLGGLGHALLEQYLLIAHCIQASLSLHAKGLKK